MEMGTPKLGRYRVAARGFFDDVHGVESSSKGVRKAFKRAEDHGEKTLMMISSEKTRNANGGETSGTRGTDLGHKRTQRNRHE